MEESVCCFDPDLEEAAFDAAVAGFLLVADEAFAVVVPFTPGLTPVLAPGFTPLLAPVPAWLRLLRGAT